MADTGDWKWDRSEQHAVDLAGGDKMGRVAVDAAVWPPKPRASAAPDPGHAPADGDVKVCGNCGRKLLTLTSALCNWCGARIDDPDYQERAAATRHELDQAERASVEAVAHEEAMYGVLGRLKRRAKTLPPGAGLGGE
ncbi:MAG: hypothetical protein ACLQVD_11310 [Capsulimonadaceae bacterium]